jgi:glycerate dehydrogenase
MTETRPRIVVLDGYTLSPGPDARGDVSWAPLEALGQLTVHERSGDRRIEHARGARIVLTNKEILDAATIEALPELRYIGVLATGTNVVDLEAAGRRGIVVTNAPAYGTAAVAQHVFALLLELVSHTSAQARAVRDGQWQRSPDFAFTVEPITELAGKTFGIVGMGAIGQNVARIASAFGMRVAAARHRRGTRFDPSGIDVDWRPLDELFATADVVSLHCPLTPRTRHLVDAARLASMRSTAILINTGRGALVDERALRRALDDGHLAGAGLDVLSVEPPRDGNPLIGAPRCVVTPHVAWATREARMRLMEIAADNVRAFLDGVPRNVVISGG